MPPNTLQIIIGQEVICPDGLGRVMDYRNTDEQKYLKSDDFVQIETYYSNENDSNYLWWSYKDITLIDPRK